MGGCGERDQKVNVFKEVKKRLKKALSFDGPTSAKKNTPPPTKYDPANILNKATPEAIPNKPIGGYTHLKVTICATPDGPDLSLCKDTGTGHDLVDRDFLNRFPDHHVEKRSSRLAAEGDDAARDSTEPATLDKVVEELPYVMAVTEAQMTSDMRQKFWQGYKDDSVYWGIIEEITKDGASDTKKPRVDRHDGDIITALKPGHPFRVQNQLLYNRDNNDIERLVIPYKLIPKFL